MTRTERYIAYFYRYGEATWVLKRHGRPATLTGDIRWCGCFTPKDLGTKNRKHQPRAVIAGRGRIAYSRRLTVIYGP